MMITALAPTDFFLITGPLVEAGWRVCVVAVAEPVRLYCVPPLSRDVCPSTGVVDVSDVDALPVEKRLRLADAPQLGQKLAPAGSSRPHKAHLIEVMVWSMFVMVILSLYYNNS